jgi:quercetin dioxygenase-like cupin family protein
MKGSPCGLAALAVLLALPARAAGQTPPSGPGVEMSGVKASLKLQAPVEGFMTALNGKVDLRATEVELQPGGTVKDHYHYGPGIRHVLAGELTLIYADTKKEQAVRAGEYFYEPGDVDIWAVNRGSVPAIWLAVELVPAGLKGSAMAPPAGRAELVASGARLKELVCPKD